MNKLITAFALVLLLGSSNLVAQVKVPVYLDDTKTIQERVEDALSRMTIQEKIGMIHAQSKFSSAGVPRLGIPEIWMSDGPHGVRPEVLWDEWSQAGWTNDSCFAFPALTCLAATWNKDISFLYSIPDNKGNVYLIWESVEFEKSKATHIFKCDYNEVENYIDLIKSFLETTVHSRSTLNSSEREDAEIKSKLSYFGKINHDSKDYSVWEARIKNVLPFLN